MRLREAALRATQRLVLAESAQKDAILAPLLRILEQQEVLGPEVSRLESQAQSVQALAEAVSGASSLEAEYKQRQKEKSDAHKKHKYALVDLAHPDDGADMTELKEAEARALEELKAACHQYRDARTSMTKTAFLLPELGRRHKDLDVSYGTAAAKLGDVMSISAFEHLQKISEFGNHPVFRAVDRETQVVSALKKFQLASPGERIRFRREAHILSSLSHPCIVHLQAIFEVLLEKRTRTPKRARRTRSNKPTPHNTLAQDHEGALYLQMPFIA